MSEHTALTARVRTLLAHAVSAHLAEDVVDYDVSLYALPTGDTWIPSVFCYVMVQPVTGADGAHLGQFLSPYDISPELVDSLVAEFAETTSDERAKLRRLRAAGAVGTGLTVAVEDGSGP